MSDPVEFLRATLAEVRASAEAAHAADPAPWTADEPLDKWAYGPTSRVETASCSGTDFTYGTGQPMRAPTAQHIAYWHPATALRMVEATEKVLELHGRDDYSCKVCLSGAWGPDGVYMEHFPCETIKTLAKGWGWES